MDISIFVLTRQSVAGLNDNGSGTPCIGYSNVQKCSAAATVRCVVKWRSTDFCLTQKIAQLLYLYRYNRIAQRKFLVNCDIQIAVFPLFFFEEDICQEISFRSIVRISKKIIMFFPIFLTSDSINQIRSIVFDSPNAVKRKKENWLKLYHLFFKMLIVTNLQFF